MWEANGSAGVKSLIRFLCLLLIVGGWGLAALSLHVVRTPDPGNAQQSQFLIIPKNRLGADDTYVDARTWTMSDVRDHGWLFLRVLQTGKADEFKYLADPKSKDDIRTQLTDALSDSPSSRPAAVHASFGGRHP
jgi:hypothetical protein